MMTIRLFITVVNLLACLLLTSAVFFANAQNIKLGESVNVPSANQFQSAVIDAEASIVLFGTQHGQICLMKYSNDNPASAPSLSFPQHKSCSMPPVASTNGDLGTFVSAVIQPQQRTALFGMVVYYGNGLSGGYICMIEYTELDFRFLLCITAAGELSAAVMDNNKKIAYFTTWSASAPPAPASASVCRVRVESHSFSWDSCVTAPEDTGATSFTSAAIDTENSVAYFCTGGASVCKLNLATFRFVSCVNLGPVSPYEFSAAAIDVLHAQSFWLCEYKLCIVNTSKANFSLISCIEQPSQGPASQGGMSTFVFDVTSSTAFIGVGGLVGSSTYRVCMFNTKAFAFGSCSQVLASSDIQYQQLLASVIDTQNHVAIFGSSDNPGVACAIDISSPPSSFSLSTCITGPAAPNSFTAAVADEENSVAYFGGMSDSQYAIVCKFALTFPNGFSFDSCIAVPGAYASSITSAVFHKQSSVAVFGLGCPQQPITPIRPATCGSGQAIVINVSASNFSFISSTNSPSVPDSQLNLSFNLQNTAVIDGKNALIYFAATDLGFTTSESYFNARVCVFSLVNFTFVGFTQSLYVNDVESSSFSSAVIDTTAAGGRPVLYFGGFVGRNSKTAGQICIFNTLPLSLRRCIPNVYTYVESAVIDAEKGVILWGVAEMYSTDVCLMNISSGTVPLCLSLSTVCVVNPSSVFGFIDKSSSTAYFGSSGSAALCAVRYSTDDVFSPTSSPALLGSAAGFASAVIDSRNSVVYLGVVPDVDVVSVPEVVKVYLNNFECGSASGGTLTLSQNLNSTATFSSLSHCNVVISHISAVSLVFIGDITSSNITFENVTFATESSAASSIPIRFSKTLSSTTVQLSSVDALYSSFFIGLDSSNPFSSTPSTTTFTLENNYFAGQQLLSAPNNVNLKGSSWSFGCNNWFNRYNHEFKSLAEDHQVSHLFYKPHCPQVLSYTRSTTASFSCNIFDQTACTSKYSNVCKFCSNIKLCVSVDEDGCPSCSALEQRSCSLTSGVCKYCPAQQICINPSTTSSCECEQFPRSLCSASSCKWCDNLNTCTVKENKNCECYFFKTEEKCSAIASSSNNCSWCSSSDPIESYKVGTTPLPSRVFNVTSAFNYCVNNYTDRCECSYLSPNFCQYASSPLSAGNYSSTCKYCSKLDLCTRQENTECDCGQEYSPHGCHISPSCAFEPAVLTTRSGLPYCTKNTSALRKCSPLACQGITDEFACAASECKYDESTKTCRTSDCFNFFVPGFTMQPYLLYFFGLFKDIIVVLLIGAIGDFFTRPIMVVVFKLKKLFKDWDHIECNIGKETLFMSDRKCRDSKKFSFSFAEYVEQICEDVFEFVDEEDKMQLLDEERRLALFDITAFCLFDNMLWIEPVIEQQENQGDDEIIPGEQEVLHTAAPSINDDDDHEEKLVVSSRSKKKSPNAKQHFTMKANNNTSTAATYSPPNQDSNDEEDHLVSAADTPRNNDDESEYNNNNNKIRPVEQVVKLTADDFKTLATLRTKVEATLLERASSFIYYTQSRSRLVSACAAINSFPSSLQLLCYITLVLALYITSFITVSRFPSIGQVVTRCNSFTPKQDAGVTVFGGFILLGFRLMNASAEATSVLILVKTIRGFYQKFTGLYSLSLQQRIPLMGLFTDRPIQITLSIYAFLILPFALAGPLYGGIKVNWRCWVPVAAGAGVIIVNWIVLFVLRWRSISQLVALDQAKTAAHAEEVQERRHIEQNAVVNNTGSSNNTRELDDNVQENDDDVDDEYDFIIDDAQLPERQSEVSLTRIVSSVTKRSSLSASKRQNSATENDDELYDHNDNDIDDTIVSAAPAKLGKAILVFLMTEELPVVAISLALQVSFNYFCLLYFKDAFGIIDENDVYRKDYHDRRLHCIWLEIKNDASAMTSVLSSFVPF